MTHNIKLNFDIDLKFKIITAQYPEIVSRVVFSTEKGRFIDIETTRSLGFVDVTFDDPSEWIAEIDGARAYENVTFDATEVQTPDGTTATLWEVYSFSTKEHEDDVEIEDVSPADIPDPIIDMMF